MVSKLAGRIIDQFAECLRARIERAPEADEEGEPAARERPLPRSTWAESDSTRWSIP